MNNIRIIPRLDIKGPNLVKGIHLEGLRVLGSPEDFAKYYYDNGADELIFQDVVASLYNRNSILDLISKTAKNIFIPITVGGGIRNLDDINLVLRAGADKITLNTAAILNPNFIKEAALKFGSSTIVIAIEAIKQPNGKYHAFIDNGREETGIEVVNWVKQAVDLGAGEILITSVDKEGTGDGLDIELTKLICKSVNVPVIAHGGTASSIDIRDALSKTSVNAFALSSILHYSTINYLERGTNVIAEEGNRNFIESGNSFKKIKPTSIEEIKKYLNEINISCRPIKRNIE